MSDPRFELRQITENEWLILDHRYEAHDSRQTIACIRESGNEVDVLWMREIPLPSRYRAAMDVLAAIQHHYNPASRSTAPVTIPHLAPIPAAGQFADGRTNDQHQQER